jgi:hypothetical protein
VTPLALRNTVAKLNAQAQRDLATLWRRMESAAQAGEALHDILPALIDTYGLAASVAAAEWYDSLREKADVRGGFIADPVRIDDTGAHALVGWALNTATDDAAFQSLVEGGMQRRIANHSRATVTQASVADPASVGWKRIGAGACEFCQMLISRDQTYSEDTADFASHDHCNCQAYPLIKGAEPIDVKKYVQSTKNAQKVGESDAAYEKRRAADRKRVREYLASN